MTEPITSPKAWLSYSGTIEISESDMGRLFPGGVPEDLDADKLAAVLYERHGNDVGGYIPSTFEVGIDVERPNPHFTQDTALLPGQMPHRTICTEAVWGPPDG